MSQSLPNIYDDSKVQIEVFGHRNPTTDACGTTHADGNKQKQFLIKNIKKKTIGAILK